MLRFVHGKTMAGEPARRSAGLGSALYLLCGLFFMASAPSEAQRVICPGDRPGGCDVAGPPRGGGGFRPVFNPPTTSTPPPQAPPPTVIFAPPPSSTVVPLVPVDVTGVNITNPEVTDPLLLSDTALSGVSRISAFPSKDQVDGDADGIIVKSTEGSEFTKNNCVITVSHGSVLVSVRAPSEYALITTPVGDVAVAKGGDAMVRYASPLRVFNLNGRGDRVKVKVTSVEGLHQKLLSVAPGYELVVGQETLGKTDLRPRDGFVRRYSKVLENGHMAVSEFSVESFMNTSQLIAQMAQKDAASKEKRILGDMSKMAAVLNQLNGVQGFVASGTDQP